MCSVTSGPRAATSMGGATRRPAGVGARRTTVGSTSGCQKTVARSAGSCGSIGKGQPPTRDKGLASCSLVGCVGGGLSSNGVVVFLIGGISTQELPREPGSIEVLQVVLSR